MVTSIQSGTLVVIYHLMLMLITAPTTRRLIQPISPTNARLPACPPALFVQMMMGYDMVSDVKTLRIECWDKDLAPKEDDFM
jgi:hypothetical protein